MGYIKAVSKAIYFKIMPQSKYIHYLKRSGVNIGVNCEIYKSANFGSEPYLIQVGNHVRINAGVQLITHDGGYWVLRDKKSGFGDEFAVADKFGKIIIHDNVHIGTNAIIMPGVEIGENSVIACGAVVTHNVPPNSVWGGVPARHIESIEEHAQKARKVFVKTKNMSYDEKRSFLMNLFDHEE